MRIGVELTLYGGSSERGKGVAKDMSKVYSEMLTKELVILRGKKLSRMYELAPSTKRKDIKEFSTCKDLLHQIDAELAQRVASFNLFV